MMPKRDHDRDVELDKKIEALRRKNEALMKRYKEVEEDKKRAEEEGMALQSPKGKADDLTITISKSTCDSRVVVTKPFSDGSPAGKGQQEVTGDKGGDGAGRDQRKQLMVTMAGKKGKRLVSEKPETRPDPSDVKNHTEAEQARHAESNVRGKQPHHTSKKGTAALAAAWQDEVKLRLTLTEEHHRLSELCKEPEAPVANTDLDIPTLREEQEEYLRWKKEREQIDKERVARHKNAKGQWRRAWDMDKTDNMFSDKSLPDREWRPGSRGGRGGRRGHTTSGVDSRGQEKAGKAKGSKKVQLMSSKAKGKDRLTGRARRWQASEDGEKLEMSDTPLEEFLKELDALIEDDVEDQTGPDSKSKLQDPLSEEVSGTAAPVAAGTLRADGSVQGGSDASSPRSSEKRVRFSEELIQGACVRQSTDAAKDPPSLKASSSKKNKQGGDASPQDEGGGPVTPPVPNQEDPETECIKNNNNHPPASPHSPTLKADSDSSEEASVHPVEVAKCNISHANTEAPIDSGLSLESGGTSTAHSTSCDSAMQDGKIV